MGQSAFEPKVSVKSGTVKDEVLSRFKHVGFAATLQKPRGMLEVVAVIPPVKDLMFTLRPGKLENEYLNFATDLYVDSVVSFLGFGVEEIDYVKLRAAWQIVELNAWREKIKHPCLIFDYRGFGTTYMRAFLMN